MVERVGWIAEFGWYNGVYEVSKKYLLRRYLGQITIDLRLGDVHIDQGSISWESITQSNRSGEETEWNLLPINEMRKDEPTLCMGHSAF